MQFLGSTGEERTAFTRSLIADRDHQIEWFFDKLIP